MQIYTLLIIYYYATVLINIDYATKLPRLNDTIYFLFIVFNKCRLFGLLQDFPVHDGRFRSVFTVQHLSALNGYNYRVDAKQGLRADVSSGASG